MFGWEKFCIVENTIRALIAQLKAISRGLGPSISDSTYSKSTSQLCGANKSTSKLCGANKQLCAPIFTAGVNSVNFTAGMLSVKAYPGFSERSRHNLHITRHEVTQADGKLHTT